MDGWRYSTKKSLFHPDFFVWVLLCSNVMAFLSTPIFLSLPGAMSCLQYFPHMLSWARAHMRVWSRAAFSSQAICWVGVRKNWRALDLNRSHGSYTVLSLIFDIELMFRSCHKKVFIKTVPTIPLQAACKFHVSFPLLLMDHDKLGKH